jgi:hypothetical protein
MIMIEAVSNSETPENIYQTTRRNNPEDSHLHIHRSHGTEDVFCFLSTQEGRGGIAVVKLRKLRAAATSCSSAQVGARVLGTVWGPDSPSYVGGK